MTDSSLYHHTFNDCLWIRCASRGSFINSPVLKALAEKYIEGGGRTIVVDLEVCPGVDSTFMGTLAGLARQLMARGGSIDIASPTERTRASMESLGLDMLIDIDPAGAFWRTDIEQRRFMLDGGDGGAQLRDLSERERTLHVLEAHNVLRSKNTRNDETFGYVCETLEEDLLRQSEEDAEENGE